MRCINKKKIGAILFSSLTLLVVGCGSGDLLTKQTEKYNTNLFTADLFSGQVATPEDNIVLNNYDINEEILATAMIDVNDKIMLQSTNLNEQIAPASATKIMTAYLALKYGDLEDMVTITENIKKLPEGSHVCGFKEGDVVSFKDLLYGLIVNSGNDAAIAISEHISGSHSEFVTLMNKEAELLGATHTNFINSHGMDATDHYTSAYDIYLIFNEVIKYEVYVEMLSLHRYTTVFVDKEGTEKEVEWTPTNYYHRGLMKAPENVKVIGGITGTTAKAKNCLVLLVENLNGDRYITLTMGAPTRDDLYENLNEMIGLIPAE